MLAGWVICSMVLALLLFRHRATICSLQQQLANFTEKLSADAFAKVD
jgi:hypothetical protein